MKFEPLSGDAPVEFHPTTWDWPQGGNQPVGLLAMTVIAGVGVTPWGSDGSGTKRTFWSPIPLSKIAMGVRVQAGVLVGVFVGVSVAVWVGVVVAVFVRLLVGVVVGLFVGALVGVEVGVFIGALGHTFAYTSNGVTPPQFGPSVTTGHEG